RDGSGFFKGQLFGIRKAIHFGALHELRAATVVDISEIAELATLVVASSETRNASATADTWREQNLLPDANAFHFCANFCDLSSNVAAGNVGQRYRHARQSVANPQIKVI